MNPRLVLVGGGHANVQVLESLARGGWPAVRVVLVEPQPRVLYTGMVPGLIEGRYAGSELSIDLRRLCTAAGAELRETAVVRVNADAGQLATTDGSLPFDLLSLDIGSVPAGSDLPGVREHALSLRPLERALEVCERLDELAGEAAQRARPVRVVVVGGGPGGVEVAFAAHRRISDRGASADVTLTERGDDVVESYPRRARRIVRHLFRDRGISLRVGKEATEVDAGGVRYRDGDRLEADAVVWLTGPAAPPLPGESGLPVSSDGYLLVDSTLRSVGAAPVWGAGDCAEIQGMEVPKAGVFAVRQGPVLAHNLRAAAHGGEPREYEPQRRFLSLLNTGDDRALLRWGAVVAHARPAWWLKDRIDRRWVERFSPAASAEPDQRHA